MVNLSIREKQSYVAKNSQEEYVMPNEAQGVVGTVRDGIEAANKALDLYNKVIDQIIPWKTFEDTIKELTRYQENYSNDAAKLVGDVKKLLLDSQDQYFSATQLVYEWCGVSSQLLQAYLTLFENFDEKKADAQKSILLKVLGDGIQKMESAKNELTRSSSSFNEAAGKLLTLQTQLANDFSTSSSYYASQVDTLRKQAYGGAAAGIVAGPFGLVISYSIAAGVLEGKLIPALKAKLASVQQFFTNLAASVTTAISTIDTTKDKLETEIKAIGEMKINTEATKFYVEYDNLMLNLLKESASNLIAQCIAYQKRHGKKN
jgi:hemolysin E